MKEVIKNKRMLYILTVLIILIGIISIFVLRLNFTVMYSNNTRISIYLGKEYNLNDMKTIAKEVLGKQEIKYQEIESFNDSLAITVKDASEEQIDTLRNKIKEKYEIDEETEIIETKEIPHLRGRDILKPYIVPMIIVTILVLAYVGIRYTNLGIFKTIFTLLLRLVIFESLLLSIIAIARIPIGIWTMPVAIMLYIIVTIITVVQYQNEIEKVNEKENKNN